MLLVKRNIRKKHRDRLERKYSIQKKRLDIEMKEMKQRVKAVGAKIKWFNSRTNNLGRFFQWLINQEEKHQCEIPNSVEAQTFWRGIWNERREHHKDAKWLKYRAVRAE